jgi:hypothetical protein
MTTTLKLSAQCLERDYHGAGKAWAAIRDGEVVALRYMGDHPIAGHGDYEVPDWVRAVMQASTGLDDSFLPVCRGSQALAALASAAQACADCPVPQRRERYRPAELLTMARAALAALDAAAFEAYRAKCRTELAELGEVRSGVAGGHEFAAK